ncbi:uncharacterized protein [Rhodnius prolixus]|uniref:uncharacterized protein n=1 Tax=Rhodnius prolixus TaxID=13249 RepID=UPI003D18AAD9
MKRYMDLDGSRRGSSQQTCSAPKRGDTIGTDSITDYLQPLVSLADQYQNNSASTNCNICLRECDGVPRICYYKFKALLYTTMSLACGRCPSVKEDCYLPQCVTADGVPRGITTFNRMLPGPYIQVCKGDTIVVDVVNKLLAGSTTVHWHGIHQRGTQYYDGTPGVTQCPIEPGDTFRYQFLADIPGSYFYHSHTGLQKEDGLSGPLIVRDVPKKKTKDIPEYTIFIQDWMHLHVIDRFPGLPALPNPARRPSSYLINGRGIYVGTNITFNEIAAQVGSKDQPPVTTLTVTQGKTYKLRLIGGTCIACAITIFIQQHKFTVISGDDGRDVIPTTVDTIGINSGERYDVLINATQPVGSYWIAVTGTGECEGAKQLAVLRYDGAPPFPAANEKITAPGPLDFNPEFSFCNISNQLCVFQLTATQPPSKELTMPKGDLRIPLAFGLYYYTVQELFYTGTYNPYFYALPGGVLLRSMINNISHVPAPSALISQYNDNPRDAFCEPQCSRAPTCICTYIIKIPLNSVVDVVIADTMSFQDILPPHPFHLHGYDFQVLEQGVFNTDPATGLKELNRRLDNGDVRNDKAPMKDVVSVAPGGYAIIRFLADNPGFWLMHCHLLFHQETGMAVVFQVGEPSDLPPIPKGFPTCGNFLPKVKVL